MEEEREERGVENFGEVRHESGKEKHIPRRGRSYSGFKERAQLSCCHWSLKKHKRVCMYLVVNPRKKESVDSELARGRVSKFY